MQKLIFVVAAMTTALATPAGPATRSYIVTDFDSIRLEAPIEVKVQTRRGVSARGEGDSDMLDRVDLSVSSRVLTIRLRAPLFEARRERASVPLKLSLSARALRRIQLAGSGTMHADGMDPLKSEIVASGSGAIMVSGIDSDLLNVVQNGAGAITLSGKAKTLGLQVVGSGTVDAKALTSFDLSLVLEGTATAEAVADRSAKIAVSGAGSATVTGKAACTVAHSGGGSVRCGGTNY